MTFPAVSRLARVSPHRAIIATVLVLAMLAGACGDEGSKTQGGNEAAASQTERASLRIAYVPATTTLPLHVAKAQGFSIAIN